MRRAAKNKSVMARFFIAVGVLLLALVAVMLVAFFVSSLEQRDRANDQRALLDTITTGMLYAEVETVLRAAQTEYSWYEQEQQFRAIVRDTARTFVVTESITYVIQMDAQGSVVSVETAPVYTGP